MANIEPVKYLCPCCGWTLGFRPYKNFPSFRIDTTKLKPPYHLYWGAASYGVCSCCGYEFGNDDNPGLADPISFEEFLESFVNCDPLEWLAPEDMPDGWNLDEQLANAGIKKPKTD